MAQQKILPKTLTMTFDDGSRAEIGFQDLPLTLQAELLRQPFASFKSPAPETEKYLVIEWKDGWREVFQVPRTCTEVNRYYVITRPENCGRLSIKKEDGYPELIEIDRDALNLRRLAFTQTLNLGPAKSDREGSKTEHHFVLEKGPDLLMELKTALRLALHGEGETARTLQDACDAAATDLCMRLAGRLNLRAGRRRQDLQDFLVYLAADE